MGHFAECCTRQRTPLPSAMVTALGKAGKMGARKTIFPAWHSAKNFFFKKNSNLAECRPEGTRQRIFLKKIQTLPSAGQRTLGKEFFLKKIQTLPSSGQGPLGKEFLEKK